MKALEDYKEKVNLALKIFLERKLEKDGKYSPKIKELLDNILEFNLRSAKRIRPIICILAYKCFNQDERIINASIALELMQSYLLIHDDIIDNSDLRRGKPSMHKLYDSLGGKFGKSIAILAGNLCSSFVYESILESEFNEKEKIEAIKYLSWINNRENYGQALDIFPGFENLKEGDIWKIYELKTSSYTTQGPIYLGCALANAPQETSERLQEYAYNLGLAFQLQDDLNGVFGKVEKTGKPNDSDIKEGKKTLLIAKTLEFSSKEDKSFILENYGKKDLTIDNLEKIKEIMIKSQALNYCKSKFLELIKKARDSINLVNLNQEGKENLLNLADYIKALF